MKTYQITTETLAAVRADMAQFKGSRMSEGKIVAQCGNGDSDGGAIIIDFIDSKTGGAQSANDTSPTKRVARFLSTVARRRYKDLGVGSDRMQEMKRFLDALGADDDNSLDAAWDALTHGLALKGAPSTTHAALLASYTRG